jgi:cell division protein FtsQ
VIFDTGERLQLPEGEKQSADALKKFAELDGTQRLLGRGYLGFDMRDPDKLVVRRQGTLSTPQTAATGVE